MSQIQGYSPLDIQGAVGWARAVSPDYAADALREREMRNREGTLQMQRAQEQRLLDAEMAKQAKLADYQRQVVELQRDPSPQRIADFMLRNPDVANETKATFDLKDSETKRREFQEMSEIYTLAMRDPKRAGAKMLERASAGATYDDDDAELARMLNSDKPEEVREALAQIGMMTFGATGDPEKFRTAYRDFYLPDLQEMAGGKIFVDKNTGRVFKSPYAPIEATPAGFYEYGDVGLPTLGGVGQVGGGQVGPGTGAGAGAGGTPAAAPGTVDVSSADSVFDGMLGLESGGQQFDQNGKVKTSPKGALGMAQIMPKTGPEAARLAGEPWDLKRLTSDPEYNKRLGRAYYNKQVQDFGNPIQAAAAYNAGPGRMRAALKKGGPDRWIDHVPKETQDYVMNLTGGGLMPESAIRSKAQAAIAAGADPAQVKARAAQMGVRI